MKGRDQRPPFILINCLPPRLDFGRAPLPGWFGTKRRSRGAPRTAGLALAETMKQASQSGAIGVVREYRTPQPRKEACLMHYVGVDVHAKRSSLCILNGDGKVVKREMVHGPWPAAVE